MNIPHRFHQQVVLKFLNKYPFLRNVIQKLNKHSSLTVFLISLAIILSFNLLSESGLYYDSFEYFEVAKTFYRQSFSFLNYHCEARGYFFPFVLFILQGLAKFLRVDAILFFRACFSLLMATFISLLIPAYFEALTRVRVAFFPRLVFVLLVIYFWQGYFLFPLSDFPALILLVACLYSLLLGLSRSEWKSWFRALLFVFAGIALSASMIVRPSYQITLLPIFIYLPYRVYKSIPDNANRLAVLGLFTVGMLLGWMPQVSINFYNFKVLSPFVQAQAAGVNLYEYQLSWGIVVQRYETTVGYDKKRPGVVFIDQQGLNIRQKMDIDETVEYISPYEYLRLLIRYPIDFAIIYFRHFFNGMDITYRTPYVEQLDKGRVLYSLLNYSLQFILLIVSIIWFPVLIREKQVISHIFILVLPAFLSLPCAVEVRFFLPIYIIVYIVVAYIFLPKLRLEWLEHRLHIIFLLYILYLLVCFAMSASAFMSVENLGYVFSH